MKPGNSLFALAAIVASSGSDVQAVETVGDIATNFTIVNHFDGEPLNLYDYEGSVILLDFFAWWCPYCQAQSPQIEDRIQRFFESQGGNVNGVPVTVITVSFDCSNPTRTDQLIGQFGLEIVADDCNATAYQQFDTRFQPHYVVINGLADAADLGQWEILHSESGYGGTTAPLGTLRGVINSVAPEPPPRISNILVDSGQRIVVTAPSPMSGTNLVQTSPNLADWTTLVELSGAGTDVEVTGPPITEADTLFLRVIRKR